jgi:hypothetical protein
MLPMRGCGASLRRGRSGRPPRRPPPLRGVGPLLQVAAPRVAALGRAVGGQGGARARQLWQADVVAHRGRCPGRRGGGREDRPTAGACEMLTSRDTDLTSRPHEIPTSRDTDLQPPLQPVLLTLEPNPDCNQAHETGGYLNYRQDDMVRGHGNQPPWKAAGRLPSTELGLQSLTLTELLSDMRHWRERKAACLAPCALPPPSPPPDASGAPVAPAALAAPGLASAAWSEVSSSSQSAAWSGVSSSSQSAAWSGVCSTRCQPPPSPSPGPRPSPSSQAWPRP